ncbi:hypothetical protein LPJ64_003903 [Coemansia asiatica]|uniref:Mitochondrial carrier n=1 Tax=Coemansia asiatica TaxID=1052880 RepID=A0A9W7XH29_9FUNG|nr:hypothetical protein LPJ64_003903 [Coemansia asiatica]
MADYTESGRTHGGNPFRPYAESTATSGSGSNGGIYDDLKNPLEGLRGMASSGNFSGSPLKLAGYGAEASGVSLEELNAIDLGYDDQLDTAQAAKELVKFAGYRFLSTLIACPFSMSQTLLQVQYLPAAAKFSEAKDKQMRLGNSQSGLSIDDDDELEDNAPDPDDPAYYEYLRARHSGRGSQYKPAARAHVDHRGYVVEAQEKDTGGFKPGYQLDALPDAKLAVLRRLIAHPTEGFLSMFKGSFSLWVYNMLHLLLQPTLEGVLNEMLGLYDSAPISTYVDSSAPSALTLVVSNAIVGWLLSPLELVRTRLMIQSASPIHRKYRGTFHALRTVSREEGGLTSLYFNTHHLVPTLIKHTLDPIFRDMGSFFLDHVAGIDPYDYPTTFALGGLVWKTVSALVMLPIDTIRSRLQAQTRYSIKVSSNAKKLAGTKSEPEPEIKSLGAKKTEQFKEFRTCVPLSSVPYTGMANCAWRIVTEEGETLKQMKKRRAATLLAAMDGDSDRAKQLSNVGRYGLRGLYPGITLQLAANVAIFGLSFITTEDVDDAF